MAQGSPQFETTLWSEVLLAAREPHSAAGQQALSRLCHVYWYPIYSFLRRRGASVEDAQDLTQGFFEHMLENGFLERADPDRGRFRSFILGAVKNYALNERDKRNTRKRGGELERVPIDAELAERWLSAEPSHANDSTKAFDRSWGLATINHAIDVLAREQTELGKALQFSALKDFLQRTPQVGEYDAIATKLKMSKGAVAAAVHRLNERLGEIVRKSVRDTVASTEMAEEELRFLYSALRG